MLKPCNAKTDSRDKISSEGGGDNARHDMYEHYEPAVRRLRLAKTKSGACGFHLTRSKWDPYPWVSAVDTETPAELVGLKAGDCVLEVNGEDVLGLRIRDIAKLVKAQSEHVTLLLWSAGWDINCDPESLCCGPMPQSLQRLSVIVQAILAIIECPVCLETISPPALQCQNGHLLCLNCRIRAEKCPVCRDRYTPLRAIVAEKMYSAITNAFDLYCSEDNLRQKLFGRKAQHPKEDIELCTNDRKTARRRNTRLSVNKFNVGKHKFIQKLLHGKAYSMEKLATTAELADDGLMLAGTFTPSRAERAEEPSQAQPGSNQLHNNALNAERHLTSAAVSPPESTASNTSAEPATNCAAQVNVMSGRYSLSTNDLSQRHRRRQQQTLATIDAQSITSEEGAAGRPPSQLLSNAADAVTPAVLEWNMSTSSLNSTILPLDGPRPPPARLHHTPECAHKPEHTPVSNAEHCTKSLRHSMTSTSSASDSAASSSGVFSSLDLTPPHSSCASTASIRDELLQAPDFAIAPAAAAVLSAFHAAPSWPPSSVELSEETPVGVADTDLTLARLPSSQSSPATCTKHSPPASSSGARRRKPSRYRCPCDCGSSFHASSQLQQHVKVEHGLPLLSFGGASAQLALPLRQPVDNAVLILEVRHKCQTKSNAVGEADGDGDNVKAEDGCADSDDDANVNSADKVMMNNNCRGVQECWIRIKTQGHDGVLLSAVLQATMDAP